MVINILLVQAVRESSDLYTIHICQNSTLCILVVVDILDLCEASISYLVPLPSQRSSSPLRHGWWVLYFPNPSESCETRNSSSEPEVPKLMSCQDSHFETATTDVSKGETQPDQQIFKTYSVLGISSQRLRTHFEVCQINLTSCQGSSGSSCSMNV